MADPFAIRTARVDGKFTLGTLDSLDAGLEPDTTPLVNWGIKLTPTPRVNELHLAVPPETKILEPILLITDATGVVKNPDTGDLEVRIWADYPVPGGGVQRPSSMRRSEITPPGSTTPLISKDWYIPLDATSVDLTTVAPIPGTTVINLDEWELLVANARAARDVAVLAAQSAALSKADTQALVSSAAAITGLTGEDAAVAYLVGDAGSSTRNALSRAYAGRFVARFITRARGGGTLKIVGLGDSITAGTGATLGTDDWLTLLRNTLAARFPSSTITQSNRALSGATIATSQIYGHYVSAIADKGDLYLIAFGKNDTVADQYALPVQGYPLAQSIRGLESMIRGIRTAVPQAEIVIVAENPNAIGDAVGNAALSAWNAKARALAVSYACEWVDNHAAFAALGDYSALLSDAVHLSVAGHIKFAGTVAAAFPAESESSFFAPSAISTTGIHAGISDIAASQGLNGWVVLSDTGGTGTGLWLNAGGGWAGRNPYQTAIAGNEAEFRFVGSELAVRFDTSAASGAVVDIKVDGIVKHTDLPLATLASAYQPFVLVASGLDGTLRHTVTVTLKSGTLKIYMAAWLAGKQQTPASPVVPRMISGRWYGQEPYKPLTFTPAMGTLYAVPFFVPVARSFNSVAVDVQTPKAGASIALGLYGSEQECQPFGLIKDFGTVDASTAGFKTLTVSVLLSPGWYWLGYLASGDAPAVRANEFSHTLVSSAAESTANPFNCYILTGKTSLPSVWSGGIASTNAPRIVLRTA